MESAIVASDKGSTTLGKNGNTKLENNSLCRCQDYSMIDGLYDNTRIAKGGTPLPHPLPRVRKHERIIHHHINTYDDWYRLKTANGVFESVDKAKRAEYSLTMGYDNLYNITSKKMTMTQTNLQFAGTLSAGHEFSYNYSNDNPMQLASVEMKQYNVDGSITDEDGALAKNIHTQDYEFDDNGNMVSVSVAKNEEENPEGEQEATEEKDVLKSFLWDEENRLLAVNNNGSVSCYFYDAAGERTVKLTSESEMVHVNGKKVGGNANICKFTAYVSPYFVVSNGGAYTKHIYAANQRIASKLGNVDGFGADPRRVEMAGGKKYSDNQSGTIKARFEALNIDYSDGNGKKDDEEYEPTMDSEEPENLVFFYHPDHLGSTSYVTDADGNIAQHIEYIPYGEVFVEERNSQFSTNFLFNAKELDNETGLYYYGARYLDPTGAMWLSVDPVFHAGTSPYAYCLGNPVKLIDPDGRVEIFKPNGKHKFSGFDLNDNTKYVVKDFMDRFRLKRGKITLDQAKSAVRLPSDVTLQTSLDVLDKTNEAGGLCEIGAIVGKNGQVVIGEPGPRVTEDMTVLGGSLPDYDFPMSEVEASIHSHMTECLNLDSELKMKYSDAYIAGPGDPEVFNQYDCNIIVGKLGAPTKEYDGTDMAGNKIFKTYKDNRGEGIGIFGRYIERGDNATLWLNKEAVLKIINYGKTQE